MEETLTYEEKIEAILSILATPIWRRRLKDDMLNKLITEAYFETKERKKQSTMKEFDKYHPVPYKDEEIFREFIGYTE